MAHQPATSAHPAVMLKGSGEKNATITCKYPPTPSLKQVAGSQTGKCGGIKASKPAPDLRVLSRYRWVEMINVSNLHHSAK